MAFNNHGIPPLLHHVYSITEKDFAAPTLKPPSNNQLPAQRPNNETTHRQDKPAVPS
tara:strand:- start:110 stop:280 length:171 start_codon:yes stop_codon:yes gene_type:complete